MAAIKKTPEGAEFRNISGQVPAKRRRWAEEFAARHHWTLSYVLDLALRELEASVGDK